MTQIARRSFLKRSAWGASALAFGAPAIAQRLSSSDEVRVGVIGFRGRGENHIEGFAGVKGARVTALCDVDKNVLAKGMKWFNEPAPEPTPDPDGKKKKVTHYDTGSVEGFTDIRRMLDSKLVDVVSIATPNHWHALAAIWAIQAGKDVYVEKPISHNVWEGRKVVEAARKYNRIVQAGTQSRSSSGLKECFAWLKEGHLGKITLARGLCYKPRGSIGRTEGPQKIPDNIDYDLWCGPAPLVPPRRNTPSFGVIHYDWHWFWDYGNGDLGNQGIHQMDICRWALGANELSSRVLSLGGRLGYVDDGETPNTQIVYHEFEGTAPLLFEVRGLPSKTGEKKMDKYMGADVGCIIHCEGGHVRVPSYTSATAYDKDGKEVKSFSGSSSHFKNFLEAVRERKSSLLHADILEGHLSSALCHTANISYRLGKQASQDEIKEAVRTNLDVSEAFSRMTEHLAANKVNLDETKATLGVPLKMDPKKERFLSNAKANEMLTREYRKPYVVPENV